MENKKQSFSHQSTANNMPETGREHSRHKTIPIFVPHWGCPEDCLFCDQKRITGQREEMTPERAAAIIRTGTAHRQPGDYLEIGFFGGSFTGIPAPQQEGLLALAQEAVAAGLVNGIRLSTRPDYINEAVLSRLLHYGVTCVELGAQSMDDEVLRISRRGHTAEQTRRAARTIREAGLQLGLQMMIGLPADSAEKAMQTAADFAALQPDCVRIYPTLVIRGTGLEALWRSGAYRPLTVEEAAKQCSRLYWYFTDKHIDVIRMGLLQMEASDVVAGPYHPAFGELVRSRLCYEQLAGQMAALRGESLQIRVHPRDVSVLQGQKKQNMQKLREDFQLRALRVVQDDSLPRGEYKVEKFRD